MAVEAVPVDLRIESSDTSDLQSETKAQIQAQKTPMLEPETDSSTADGGAESTSEVNLKKKLKAQVCVLL